MTLYLPSFLTVKTAKLKSGPVQASNQNKGLRLIVHNVFGILVTSALSLGHLLLDSKGKDFDLNMERLNL